MTRSNAGFDLARPTGKCAATDSTIDPGARFVATLLEDPEQGYARQDFTEAAWAKGARPEHPMVGYWRAVMPERDAPKQTFIGDEALEDLFEQLGEATEPKRVAMRFILALILIRKRLLRVEGSKGSAMLVRGKGVALPPERGGDGPSLVVVEDPGLDEQAIEDLTEEVGQLLNLEGVS